MEAIQLGVGEELLGHARQMFDDPKVPAGSRRIPAGCANRLLRVALEARVFRSVRT